MTAVPSSSPPPTPVPARRPWLRALTTADRTDFDRAWQGLCESFPLCEPEAVAVARPPEIGLALVRGRIGGDGEPFAMGEATVTRCAVERSVSGGCTVLGLGYLLGRDRERSFRVACLDALLQDDRWSALVDQQVVQPLDARVRAAQAERAAAVAATRVEFVTMVRGD